MDKGSNKFSRYSQKGVTKAQHGDSDMVYLKFLNLKFLLTFCWLSQERDYQSL